MLSTLKNSTSNRPGQLAEPDWWIRLNARGDLVEASEGVAKFLGFTGAAEMLQSNHNSARLAGLREAGSTAWRLVELVGACGSRVAVYARPWPGRNGAFHLSKSAGGEGLLAVDLDAMHGCWLPLFELSQSGLCIKGTDSRLIYVNRALADMLGYEPEEMTGFRCRDIVVPEDVPKVERVLGEEPWEPGEMREIALRVHTREGASIRNVVARYRRIDYNGHGAVVGSIMDVTDLRRGETALRDYARRLQLLSRQVIEVQEHERCNLARELHDEIGQQLTMVKLSLESVKQGCEQERMLDIALEGIANLTRQVRDMSLDLRPSMLDDLGLVPALRWYSARAAKLADMSIEFNVSEHFPRMRTDVETLFFRVAQEAVTNALRHSAANSLKVTAVAGNEWVEMEISDDGQGFDKAAVAGSALSGRSAGLLGMQERAGLLGADLEIRSAPNAGTQLRLRISAEGAGIRGVDGQISGKS